MLITALGVEVAGEAQLRLRFEYGGPTGAGIDPDVEDVRLAAELGAAAIRCSALRASGQNGFGCPVVPEVYAIVS